MHLSGAIIKSAMRSGALPKSKTKVCQEHVIENIIRLLFMDLE